MLKVDAGLLPGGLERLGPCHQCGLGEWISCLSEG